MMNIYPQKPKLIEPEIRTNWGRNILSIILFVFTFTLLFSNEIGLIIGLVIVLFVRELGHFLAMKYYKYEKIRLLFIPLMGAFVHGKKERYSQKECLMVVVLGFLPGVVLGFLLMFFSQYVNSVLWFQMGLMFFVLNIVNLVPLDPLDGGQLFKLIVSKTHEKWMLYFTLFFSILIICVGFGFSSYVITLFGFLMGFRVRNLQKVFHLHRIFSDSSILFHTTYQDLPDKHFWKIKEILLEQRPSIMQYIQQMPESEQNAVIANQVNAMLITPVKKDTSLFILAIIILLWILSSISPFVLWLSIDLNWVHYVVRQMPFFV